MTPEQLREACEVAGLETEDRATNGLWVVRLETEGDIFFYSELSPMLPSYVADLLIGKVTNDWQCWRYITHLTLLVDPLATDNTGVCATANPNQRITAAMKALGHWS